MRVIMRLSMLLCAAVLWGGGGYVRAQVPATINIPSSGYPDLKAAVDALNNLGVGTGGCVVTLLPPAGLQVAPAGGYHLGSDVLNASVAAAKPITIKGNGHTLGAFTPGTGSLDGIFFVEGVDYLTIDSLNLLENAANTTNATRMEWGYALIKRNTGGTGVDGCRYITIKNCTISLDSANTGSIGIYSGNHLVTNTTALVPANINGTNSNNTFSRNTIQKVRTCISLNGYADPANILYDQDNMIGGTSAIQGNIFQRFGAVTSNTRAMGAYLINQHNVTVRFNTIDNAAGGGAQNNGFLIGVYYDMTAGATFNCLDNTIRLTQQTNTTYGIYAEGKGNGTFNILRNKLKDFRFTASNGSALAFISLGGAPRRSFISDNEITDHVGLTKASGNVDIISCLYSWPADTSDVTVSGNIVNNITKTTASTNTTFSFYRTEPADGPGTVKISGNRITNCVLLGSNNVLYGVYTGSGASSAQDYEITGNVFDSLVTTNGATSSTNNSVYIMRIENGRSATITSNTINNITGSGLVYGCYFGDDFNTGRTLNPTVSRNNISKLINMRVSSSAGTPEVCGIRGNSGNNIIYNNVISDLRSSSSATGSYSTIAGIYLNGSTTTLNEIYYNTIYLGNNTALTGIGAAALVFWGNYANTVKNNIFHVNAIGSGAGNVAVIRRVGGGYVAGTPPSATGFDANNNIYYTPAGAANFLYLEGTGAPFKNGYALSGLTPDGTNNMVNDPGFNSGCGLYKSFMAGTREKNSFTENNIIAGSTAGVFYPANISYAESGAAVIGTITDDYSGGARGTTPDIGAMQFSGVAATTPPLITYTTTPPATTYCTTIQPTLVATITTAAGSINTTTGTAPRLYYKKSTETNAFGTYPGDNVTSFNGWKYVEGTNSGSTFSFPFNYNILNTPLQPGDSIVYFVIAQDNAGVPNVAVNQAGFSAGCGLPGVNLTAAVGGVLASPVSKGFRVLTVPSALTATASQGQYCTSGVAYLSLSPVPPGNVSLQWQQDGGIGTWSDIGGATSATHTSATLTSSNNYRVQVRCGGTSIATSSVASITIAGNPSITGTTGATRCGNGTVTLNATGSGSSSVLWYNALTGGAPVHTGSSFTTPVLTGTTSYYVSAFTGLTGGSVGEPTTKSPSFNATRNRGLAFDALSSFTLQSVAIYPVGTGAGTVTIQLIHESNTAAVLQTITATVTGTTQPGLKTVVPINFLIPQGTGYLLLISDFTGSVTGFATDFFTGGGGSFPYTQPGVVSIKHEVTMNSNGTIGTPLGSYHFLYDWNISIGCETTPRIQVTATVNTPPSITASANPDTICGSAPVNLSATSSNSSYIYSWTPGGLTGASVSVTPAGTTKYYVTASDNSGGTHNGCNTTDSVSVTVNPKPVATFAPLGLTSFCAGDSVELHAGSGASTYQWQMNGANIGGATNSILVARDSGNYRVLVSNLLCDDTSSALLVSVFSLPVPTITRVGNVLSTQGGYSSYQWYIGSTLIPGATSSSYTALVNGDYTVKVLDGNSCEGASLQVAVVLVPEGIAVLAGTPIAVYPNPARSVVYVQSAMPVNISIASMDGKTILQRTNTNVLQIGSLADGIYMIRITDAQGMLLRLEKLVKNGE